MIKKNAFPTTYIAVCTQLYVVIFFTFLFSYWSWYIHIIFPQNDAMLKKTITVFKCAEDVFSVVSPESRGLLSRSRNTTSSGVIL